ncbi:WhiB family transcriptional regulator [Streptomyces sp. NPDC002520]
MSGPRTGIPIVPAVVADDRIPFPHTDAPTRCQDDPKLFAIEDVTERTEREKALAKAKLACSGCPIVTGCLKWALANRQLTPTGVWAATTARERTKLRKDLVRRLGKDWVGVVAEQDRRRQEKQLAARLAPPTVRATVMARLELELIPTRPAPYEPWKEPMTPARQAQNWAVLKAALSTKAAA